MTDSGNGAAGLWNIFVNSPGSVEGVTGGRGGGGSGVTRVAAAAGGAAGVWNIFVKSPASDDRVAVPGIWESCGALAAFAGLENAPPNSSLSASGAVAWYAPPVWNCAVTEDGAAGD
jgi:hypothetical protein